MHEVNERAWRWVHRAVAAATVLPLLFSHHPPFSDLPEHLALIATLRHWWDSDWQSQTYFQLAGLGHTQYWLYYVVGALLAFPLKTAENAALFLTALSGLGFPYALRALARALGRDPRVGLIGAPLFWNLALAEGLMSYVAAVPLAFLAIALAVRQMGAPERTRAFLVALLPLALFYLHISAFAFFVLATSAAAAVLALDVVRRPLRSIPGEVARRLPWLPVCLALLALFASQSIIAHPEEMQREYAGVVRFLPMRVLIHQLPRWTHDFWVSPWDDRLGYVLWTVIGILLLSSLKRERPSRSGIVAGLLVAVAAAMYFLMPTQVGYAFLLDLRMAPVLAMSVGLLIHGRSERINRVCFGAIALVGVAVGAHSAVQMQRFEREEAAHFELLLRNLPKGKRLLMLIFQRDSRIANIAPFVHFGSYYRARYGGIASFSFTELPHWPLQYRPELAPPKKNVTFWDWNPCLFRNSTDGPYYDFVLTRGDVRPFVPQPPGPQWIVIGGARDWTLYARKDDAPPWPADRPDSGPCVIAP